MKRCILIFLFTIFVLSIGFSDDLKNVYVKATRMFDEGKYFESYKILDEVIKEQTNVPDQFFVKLIYSVKEGYLSGSISFESVSNILENYLIIGQERNIVREEFWQTFLFLANDVSYYRLIEESCKELLAVNPSNEQGLFTLSKILFYNKEYDLSLKVLEKMLNMGFDYVSPLILLSRIYSPNLSNIDKFINSLTNYSPTLEILNYVATIYYLRMEFDKALNVFSQDLIGLNPELYIKLLILNNVSKSKVNEIYAMYRNSLSRNFINFLNLYLNKGNVELENFLQDQLANSSDESFEPLYINLSTKSKLQELKKVAMKKMAYGFFSNKLYDKVIAILEKEKKLDDDMKYILSLSYIENKKYRKAINLLKKIGKLDLSVRLKLILAYIGDNDYTKAKEEANRIFKNVLNSDNDFYKYILSYVFIEIEDIEKSQKLIETVNFKNTPYYYLTLGSIYFYRKDYEKAEKFLEEGYKNNRFNQDIINSLSFVLATQEKSLNRALKLSRFLMAIDDENYIYLDTLAYVYYKLGDYQDARFLIEKSISLMEKDNKQIKEIYEHASKIYLCLGDSDKSEYMLVRSRSIRK